MNAERRKKLSEAKSKLDEALNLIDEVISDEQEMFDNLSEGQQTSERGEKIQACLDLMAVARGDIEDAQSNLEEASA